MYIIDVCLTEKFQDFPIVQSLTLAPILAIEGWEEIAAAAAATPTANQFGCFGYYTDYS